MTVISTVLSFIEGLISEINHYTIALAGITGESFYVSAKSSSKMFRRNLLSGLLGGLFHISTQKRYCRSILTCSFN